MNRRKTGGLAAQALPGRAAAAIVIAVAASNGQYCADDTGASLYFPGIGRANWDCPHGLGWGTVHRDGRYWTMAYSSLASAIGHKAPRLTEIPIKTAWF